MLVQRPPGILARGGQGPQKGRSVGIFKLTSKKNFRRGVATPHPRSATSPTKPLLPVVSVCGRQDNPSAACSISVW